MKTWLKIFCSTVTAAHNFKFRFSVFSMNDLNIVQYTPTTNFVSGFELEILHYRHQFPPLTEQGKPAFSTGHFCSPEVATMDALILSIISGVPCSSPVLKSSKTIPGFVYGFFCLFICLFSI